MTLSHAVAALAERSARRPWLVLALALLLSILAVAASRQLPVYTSRQALLPQNTPVAARFDRFLKDFGAASDLIVILEGAPAEELKRFADDLARRLRTEPEVGEASERLDVHFFLENAYLSVPPDQLVRLKSALAENPPARIPADARSLEASLRRGLAWFEAPPLLAKTDLAAARQGLDLAGWFLGEWRRWLVAPEPPSALDLVPLLERFGAGDLARDYFQSRDGGMLFVFVHPAKASSEFKDRAPFVEKVRKVADELQSAARAAGRPVPKVGLTGLPAVEYEEYIDVEKDIIFVVSTAAAAIAALILLVVRSVRWALAIFIPMGFGALWGLGLAYLTVGHLTIITSGFLAILFGLGVDYGIFTSSRIAEERRAGRPLIEAIGVGIGSSFQAVLTSGGASVLIFGALATVDFPGFAELGRVAAGGVLLILLSTWMVQPALYALLPPRLKELRPSDTTDALESVPQVFLPQRLAAAIAVLAVASAVYGASQGLRLPFDYDVLSLLPKDSEAAHYQRRMVAESEYQSEVIIFTAKDLAEARRITAEAEKLPTIAKVQSLTGLFPEDAEGRAGAARAVADAAEGYGERLAGLARMGLPPAAFAALQKLLDRAVPAVDDFQEQAFSAGHGDLVQGLETVRGRLEAIRAEFARDPVRGRERSELFLRAVLGTANSGLKVLDAWHRAAPLTPAEVPGSLRSRFFAADGTIAIYAFPKESVYSRENLVRLTQDVYRVSPEATGFPTTHLDFSDAVVESFSHGTLLAVAVCLVFLLLVLRSLQGFVLAALPLLIGGGWMLGILAASGTRYNYANIIALPLVIALAVDYGVWFSHRWRELKSASPLAVSLIAGRVIALAAGTELAGLGAITLASYRGVASLGVAITVGLLCCLPATLLVGPAIGQLLDPRRIRL